MKTLTPFLALGLAALPLVGCGEEGILLAEVIVSTQRGSSDSDPPDGPATATLEGLLLDNCGECHQTPVGQGSGSLDNITEIDRMIERGLIVPGNPDVSPIVIRIENGSMPPAFLESSVSEEDLARIRELISSMDPEPPSGDEVALEDVLLQHCGGCHQASPGEGSGGLDVIGDVDALIAQGLIVPGDRDASAIYVRMEQRSMPPAFIDPPVPDADIEAVGRAIDAL